MLKSFLKDTAAYGIVNFITSFVAFFIFPIYTRYLSISDYGLMALIASITGIVTGVLQFGIPSAMQRFYYDQEEDKNRIIHSSVLMTTLLNSIPVLILLSITYLFRDSLPKGLAGHFYFLLLEMIIIPLQALKTIYIDIQRLDFNFKIYSVIEFTGLFMSVCFPLFFLIILHRGLGGVYEGSAIGMAIAFAISTLLLRKHLGFNIKKKTMRKLFTFGFPFVFANIAAILFSSVDSWIIAFFHNNKQIGLYAIGVAISKIILFFITAVSMTWAPYVFKLFGEDKHYKEKICNIFNVVFSIISFFAIAVIVYAKELLQILTPNSYWPSNISASLLTLGALFTLVFQLFALGISLEKKTKMISYGWILTTILNVLLDFALIPKLGHIGASISTTTSYLFLGFFFLYHSQKLHPMPIKTKNITLILGAATILCALTLFINHYKLSFLTNILIKSPIIIAGTATIYYSNLIKKGYYYEFGKIAKRIITKAGATMRGKK